MVGIPEKSELAPGETTGITVAPQKGLSPADYTAVLTVSTDHDTQAQTELKFVVMADTNPPEGSITISDMTWNKWLNQITFGRFFNKTQKVEITAHDTGTGIANIVYYVAEGEQSVKQLNALPNGKWNLYEKEFMVEPDGRMVVYAKITDKAGNTAMANVQVYVQKVTQPPVFIGISDGGIYCENVKFTVEDDNLEKVFAGDTQLTADNGIYTIQGSNQPVKVTAVHADGNCVEVTVKKKEDVSEAQQAQAKDSRNSRRVRLSRLVTVPLLHGCLPYWH